jgi:hypothetical protein
MSVYFNIRNTLPKSGTFLLEHPVYICYAFVGLDIKLQNTRYVQYIKNIY